MVRHRPPVGVPARSRRLRRDATDAEKVVWGLLRENFPEGHFRRQVPIRNFIADFVSHRARLVIEIDGGQHGDSKDLRRTAMIETEGYRVIRFWNTEVLCNREGVWTAIAEVLHERHPHPTLPHQGGGL